MFDETALARNLKQQFIIDLWIATVSLLKQPKKWRFENACSQWLTLYDFKIAYCWNIRNNYRVLLKSPFISLIPS